MQNSKKSLYPFIFLQPRSAGAFPTFQIEMFEIAFLFPQEVWSVVFASQTVHREMVFGVLCCLYLFGFHSVPQLVNKSFPPLMLGTLDSSCLLILLIYTKHKDSKVKTWTDPTSSFLFHWVDKAKNVWIIVGKLLIKS